MVYIIVLVMNWAAKTLRICVSALLCASLFATGLMAAPDCGTRCCCSANTQMPTQHAMPMKIQSPQGCCGANGPMPCDIQSAQPYELPDALFANSYNLNPPAMGSFGGLGAVVSNAGDDAGACHPFSINHNFRSPPLYLANLAILA